MECQKIIVDCDAGIDDALALAMLIAAHKIAKIKILAITCVYGNTKVDNVINNVFRTLNVCKSLDIPVYKGAASALLSKSNVQIAVNHGFHGIDGFGDVFTDKPNISKLKEEHAVFALNNITAKYYSEVIIICLAPLTNIALAIKMYPDFVSSVKKFLIMGGSLSGGNVTSYAEFNFYTDPESVHIVLNNANKKIWIIPWETCLETIISYEWRYNIFGKIESPIIKLLNTIEGDSYSDKNIQFNYTVCDAFVVGFLLRHDIANKTVMHHLDIELSTLKNRGQVLIDHSKEPNAYIIEGINDEIFKDLLLFTADPNGKNNYMILQK